MHHLTKYSSFLFIILLFYACKKKEIIVDEPTTNNNGGGNQPIEIFAQVDLEPFNLVSVSEHVNTPVPQELVVYNNLLFGIKYSSSIATFESSSDHGQTWNTAKFLPNGGVARVSSDTLFLVEAKTRLSYSTNGVVFTTINTPNIPFTDPYNLTRFEASDDLLVISLGNHGFQQNDKLFVSTDNGNTFIERANFPYQSLEKLQVQGDNIWIVKNDSVFKSTDYGITWNYQNLGISNIFHFKSVANTFFINSSTSQLYSTDYGNTWQSLTLAPYIYPMGLLYNGDIIGYSTSGGGKANAFRSSDGGNSWYEMGIVHQYGEAVSSATHTYVSGQGNISYISDGYPNFKLVRLPDEQMTDIEFNGDRIYTASLAGYYYLSLDKGKTWDLRKTTGNWPAPSCLAFHPDGRILSNYGGTGTTNPMMNVFDGNFYDLQQTKTFGITGATISELYWLNGKFIGLFTDNTNDVKYPAVSDWQMSNWQVKTSFGLQAGAFLDAADGGNVIFTLIDGKYNNVPQLAYTSIPDVSDFFWNGSSYKCKKSGVAKSIAYMNSRVLVLYDNNQLYINDNNEFTKQFNFTLPSEVATKIRLDEENFLWVITNYGVYKSDVKMTMFEI